MKNNYDFKCDIWSAGVILYIMLAGRPPFNGETDTDIMGKIKSGMFKMRARHFNDISEEALAFLRRLMSFNPNDRPTATEALKDPWFNPPSESKLNTSKYSAL